MITSRSSYLWIDLATRGRVVRGLAASLLALALAGCGNGGGGGGGGGGAGTAAGPGAAAGGAAALAASAALSTTITGVTINSPPVVNFTVTNEAGVGMAGLTAADLRFNIAKLMPGSNGGPSTWQNYINRANGGAVQGTQERSAAGYAFGTLANNGNGSYTYTFATDIKNGTCPAPCADASGNALDISYQPGLTHRVTIQQANSAYPKSAATFDFVPAAGGAGAIARDIVSNAKCNACHNQLTAHGTRVDTRLCVTCHNPGSWVAGTSSTPNTTVDFKVMIHRIHYNVNNNTSIRLPSVLAGTAYKVGNVDFSNIVFTQDVRNCSKCHDGTPGAANATAQGDNWKNSPSRAACGSCHDGINFATGKGVTIADAIADLAAGRAPGTTATGHIGGVMTDDSACALCHAAGKFTGKQDIAVAHSFPQKLKDAAAKFKYNILGVTWAGSVPTISFSVTDPTNGGKAYDITADAPFSAAARAGGVSTLNVKLGWMTTGGADISNDAGTGGLSYGQPITISAFAATGTPDKYTVTAPAAPAIPATGTLRVMMDGHPAADVTTAGSFVDRLPVTSVFKDCPIGGACGAPLRRSVVDVAKCDVCHGVLSLHGNNRSDEPGVCVVCHNPNATDRNQRIAGGAAGEESIDFKRMIHAIHAGQSSNGGFRTTGITVYGFGGRPNDFSKVVFPGKLNDCSTCHTGTSYQLTGNFWTAPVVSKILGSTISTGASASDPSDNLRITPIAAVCSSCHDSATATVHMQDAFNAANFSATQATISTLTPEACSFCHGPGKALDVQVVHGVK